MYVLNDELLRFKSESNNVEHFSQYASVENLTNEKTANYNPEAISKFLNKNDEGSNNKTGIMTVNGIGVVYLRNGGVKIFCTKDNAPFMTKAPENIKNGTAPIVKVVGDLDHGMALGKYGNLEVWGGKDNKFVNGDFGFNSSNVTPSNDIKFIDIFYGNGVFVALRESGEVSIIYANKFAIDDYPINEKLNDIRHVEFSRFSIAFITNKGKLKIFGQNSAVNRCLQDWSSVFNAINNGLDQSGVDHKIFFKIYRWNSIHIRII